MQNFNEAPTLKRSRLQIACVWCIFVCKIGGETVRQEQFMGTKVCRRASATVTSVFVFQKKNPDGFLQQNFSIYYKYT